MHCFARCVVFNVNLEGLNINPVCWGLWGHLGHLHLPCVSEDGEEYEMESVATALQARENCQYVVPSTGLTPRSGKSSSECLVSSG